MKHNAPVSRMSRAKIPSDDRIEETCRAKTKVPIIRVGLLKFEK